MPSACTWVPSDTTFKPRHRMFLNLVEPILEVWDAALAAEGGIDFEDMLNQAGGQLESGRYEAPYALVMANQSKTPPVELLTHARLGFAQNASDPSVREMLLRVQSPTNSSGLE